MLIIMEQERVWETVRSDIPQLLEFCEQNVQRYCFLEQEESGKAESERNTDG